MSVALTHRARTPGSTQWGLDTFTEHYKADEAADVVMTDSSVPQKGDPHPDYSGMFVTDRYCTETGESASALDVVYMGSLGGTSTLPPQQRTSGTQLVSSTSSAGPIGGFTLGSPVTIQNNALTNTLSYFSYGAPGTTAADDPSGEPEIVSFSFAATAIPFGFSGDLLAYFLYNFFVTRITHTIQSTEVVAGQYWHNVSTKQKAIIPYDFPP